jgi:Na+-transporting methylmalonyl-CoA/oxaloacetate decarboxylase gamma subunit
VIVIILEAKLNGMFILICLIRGIQRENRERLRIKELVFYIQAKKEDYKQQKAAEKSERLLVIIKI